MIRIFIVINVFLLNFSNADEVINLPGLVKPINFKHYSGYLNASSSRFLHYWFVESQSNPQKDPLLLWMNGGPGCSSMDGFLSELGPFLVNDDGATLRLNPYAWNRKANVLFLEAPAGVGYSYVTDGDLATNDDKNAAENYAALKHFFEIFNQFRYNDFYITGESYGGIYVPTLAQKVVTGLDEYHLNLKGIAVGNGMLDYDLNANTIIDFAYHHGLIDEKTWKVTKAVCCSTSCEDSCNFSDPDAGYCNNTVDALMHQIYDMGLNMYDLYRECVNPAPVAFKRFRFDFNGAFPKHKNFPPKIYRTSKKLKQAIPCLNDTAITTYLNRLDVKDALHIIADNSTQWAVCSEQVGQAYTNLYKNMNNQFQILLDAQLRILVYNGDTDMACNFLMNQKFVASLNRMLISPKQPWHVDGQIAGYVTKYRNLDFVTIKGIGHMVPQWKPKQAYHMLKSYLSNVPL